MNTNSNNQIRSPIRYRWATLRTLIKSGLVALALLSGLALSAQTIVTSTNFPVGIGVPDNTPSGLASATNVSTPITYITGVKVSLKLTGTWNGDLYCYLQHSSGFSVLLNRVGRSSTNSLGYGDSGLNLTFDDASTNGDIHVYRQTLGGAITNALGGVWAPDGRTTDPATVLDSSARPAMLGSFNGLNPNGEWVLFVADMDAGDLFSLDSWGMEITGYTPPSIVSQPGNTNSECSAGTPSFAVTAAGSSNLVYQWRFNAAPIAGATDMSYTLTNPNLAAAGNYDVVVTNNYGSITSSVATLTIADTTRPTLVGVPADTAAPCDTIPARATVTATDTCDPAPNVTFNETSTQDSDVTKPGHYSYVITRTWTATDGSGNSTNQSQQITVSDTVKPTLAGVPGDAAASCDAIPPAAAVTATDNCDPAPKVTLAETSTQNPDATTIGHYTYTITRTWTATDVSGNSDSATQHIAITDTGKPSLVGVPGDTTVACDSVPAAATVTATDTCDPAPKVTMAQSSTQDADVTKPAHYGYTITRTWTATDVSGNSSSQSQTITVSDTTAPVVTLVGSNTLTNECHSAFADPGASANDNCAGTLSVVTTGTVNANAVGSYTLTYTATDPSGNIGTTNRTVYVIDTTPPTIACPANISVFTTNTAGTTVTFAATSTDLCSTPTVTYDHNPGDVFPVGTTTVTATATDASGNHTNCTFTVTVTHNDAPLAGQIALGAIVNHPRMLGFDKILGHSGDIDKDSLSVTAVSATSTNGGTVLLTETNIIYTPAPNFVGADAFSYTVDDGRGATATANVLVTVQPAATLNIIGQPVATNGTVVISFAGIPGYTYSVERSSDQATWSTVGTFTVPSSGVADFTDSSPIAAPYYYRTAQQ